MSWTVPTKVIDLYEVWLICDLEILKTDCKQGSITNQAKWAMGQKPQGLDTK